jgi:hypothetical protein
MRVKAALLRSVPVNLAELRRVLMCESRGCGTHPDAGCEGGFKKNVVGVADLACPFFAPNLEDEGGAMKKWVFDCMWIDFNDIS